MIDPCWVWVLLVKLGWPTSGAGGGYLAWFWKWAGWGSTYRQLELTWPVLTRPTHSTPLVFNRAMNTPIYQFFGVRFWSGKDSMQKNLAQPWGPLACLSMGLQLGTGQTKPETVWVNLQKKKNLLGWSSLGSVQVGLGHWNFEAVNAIWLGSGLGFRYKNLTQVP